MNDEKIHVRMLRSVTVCGAPDDPDAHVYEEGRGYPVDEYIARRWRRLGWADWISLPRLIPPPIPAIKPPALEPVETAPQEAVRETRVRRLHSEQEGKQ